MQRCLVAGFRSGLATGAGAASAGAVYGLFGAIGVASMVNAFPRGAIALQLAGGEFLLCLAWTISRQAKAADDSRTRVSAVGRDFLFTFLLTLSNPLTLLSFVAIFAAFGTAPAGSTGAACAVPAIVVADVFCGSIMWWLILCGLTTAVRTRISGALA